MARSEKSSTSRFILLLSIATLLLAFALSETTDQEHEEFFFVGDDEETGTSSNIGEAHAGNHKRVVNFEAGQDPVELAKKALQEMFGEGKLNLEQGVKIELDFPEGANIDPEYLDQIREGLQTALEEQGIQTEEALTSNDAVHAKDNTGNPNEAHRQASEAEGQRGQKERQQPTQPQQKRSSPRVITFFSLENVEEGWNTGAFPPSQFGDTSSSIPKGAQKAGVRLAEGVEMQTRREGVPQRMTIPLEMEKAIFSTVGFNDTEIDFEKSYRQLRAAFHAKRTLPVAVALAYRTFYEIGTNGQEEPSKPAATECLSTTTENNNPSSEDEQRTCSQTSDERGEDSMKAVWREHSRRRALQRKAGESEALRMEEMTLYNLDNLLQLLSSLKETQPSLLSRLMIVEPLKEKRTEESGKEDWEKDRERRCQASISYLKPAADLVVVRMDREHDYVLPREHFRLSDEEYGSHDEWEAKKEREDLKMSQIEADAGDTHAQFVMSWRRLMGHGVAEDPERAFRENHNAAELGDPAAVHNEGYMYLNGEGVPRDVNRAVELFRNAAAMGMPESLNALGFMYYKGYGVEKNITEAEKYFQIAAKDGSKDGYYNLGLIAYNEHKNFTAAFHYFKTAEETGHQRSMFMVALMMLDGLGTERTCYDAWERLMDIVQNYGPPNDAIVAGWRAVLREDWEEALWQYGLAAVMGSPVGLSNVAQLYRRIEEGRHSDRLEGPPFSLPVMEVEVENLNADVQEVEDTEARDVYHQKDGQESMETAQDNDRRDATESNGRPIEASDKSEGDKQTSSPPSPQSVSWFWGWVGNVLGVEPYEEQFGNRAMKQKEYTIEDIEDFLQDCEFFNDPTSRGVETTSGGGIRAPKIDSQGARFSLYLLLAKSMDAEGLLKVARSLQETEASIPFVEGDMKDEDYPTTAQQLTLAFAPRNMTLSAQLLSWTAPQRIESLIDLAVLYLKDELNSTSGSAKAVNVDNNVPSDAPKTAQESETEQTGPTGEEEGQLENVWLKDGVLSEEAVWQELWRRIENEDATIEEEEEQMEAFAPVMTLHIARTLKNILPPSFMASSLSLLQRIRTWFIVGH